MQPPASPAFGAPGLARFLTFARPPLPGLHPRRASLAASASSRNLPLTLDALSPAAVPAAALPRRRALAPALVWLGVGAAALAWSILVRLPLWRMDGLDDAFYVEVAHLWTRGLPPYLYA